MSFTITNIYYKLVIRLKTNLTTIPTLTYKHIESFNITNTEVLEYTTHTAKSSYSNGVVTYVIPLRNFSVGDVLKDFVCTLEGTQNLYSLNEGIIILVDGQETDVIKVVDGNTVVSNNNYVKLNPLNQSQFALVFEDTDAHTVQAVYCGNSSIGVGMSDKVIVTPKIREEHEEHPEIEGSYLIEFLTFQDKITYLGDVEWVIKLTKGGVGIANALIQVDNPRATYTHITNQDGIVRFIRNPTQLASSPNDLPSFRNWKVGTYTIQAKYYHYDETEDAFKEIICKTSKTLTITKGNPSMSVVQYAQTRTGTAKFKFKDPAGFGMPNIKLVCVVNGRTYTKTTDDNGIVSFKVGIRGNIRYKFTYAGNENMNSKSWTFSENIS